MVPGLGAARRGAGNSGDLTGVWTLGSYTDFQRPKELHSLVLTPAQADAYEAPRRALGGMPASKDGELGQAESEFNERGSGLARVNGEIRSSWIINPADGQIPYTAAAKARFGLDKDPPLDHFDNPEDLNGATRCVFNSAAGAPMMGNADSNLFEITETPGNVVILTEKFHDARIIRLGANLAPDLRAPAWLGDSVGHWEGKTLMVETAGFRPGDTWRSRLHLSPSSRVTERFTRAGPKSLYYQFTVEDPTLFTQVWRGEMMLDRAKGRIFEYACHEGNYSMSGILAGARHEETEAAARIHHQ